MYGAIIGDIAGSYYEVVENTDAKMETPEERYRRRIRIFEKKVPLLHPKSTYTDDTVLTLAVLESVLTNQDYAYYLKKYGREEQNLGVEEYGKSRFGKSFLSWLDSELSCDSYGNGSAMRVSPIGFLFDDLEEIKKQTFLATATSHNHPESILCAEAVAVSIYYLRKKVTKEKLKDIIEKEYFSLNFNLLQLQQEYTFTLRAILSVPHAIWVFLNAKSFEETIRRAISIGGDADTIASIAGALAEAHYGISEELKNKANFYLKEKHIKLLKRVY